MVKRGNYAFEKALQRAANPGAIGENGSAMLSALFPGGQHALASRDVRTVLGNYKNLPWLMACANKVMNTVAAQTWRLYYRVGPGGKPVKDLHLSRLKMEPRRKALEEGVASGEYREIVDHPMLDMLDAGNSELTGGQCRGLTVGYYDLAGEALWIIERGMFGQPVAFWPVPPHWVENLPTPLKPYYEVSINSWTGRLPVTEAVLFRNPDPFNPYARGIGKAPALSDELETDEYASKHLAAWFKNRARPDFLVMGKISPADSKRMEREWIAESRGFWNAFKPRFLSGTDFQIHEMSQSFKDMGLVDLRKYTRDFVAQTWGVPLEIMGVVENSNRSTIDMADYIFMRHTIEPRLEYQCEVMQERLCPLFDERLIVGYDSPVPEDKEFKLKVMEKAPWAFSANEWRNSAGFDAMPEQTGEFYMVPLQLLPTTTPNVAPPIDEAPVPADALEDYEGEKKKIAHLTRADDPLDLTDIGFEVNAQPVLTVSEAEIIVNQIQPSILHGAVRPVLAATIQAFGEAAIQEVGVGISFDMSDPRVTDFLRRQSSDRITGMVNETTRKRIRETLSDAIALGEDMRQVQSRVVEVFDAARGFRSLNIARTETHRAANFGSYEGYRDSGASRLQWLATRGSNNRDTHAPGNGLDGQIRQLNDPFVNMLGYSALYPGNFGIASEDCMCQCRVVAYFGERGMTEAAAKSLWKSFIDREKPYIRQFQKEIRKAFTAQQAVVLEALERIAEKKS